MEAKSSASCLPCSKKEDGWSISPWTNREKGRTYENHSKDLIAQLEDGTQVQKGERVALLQEYERRIVAWKDVVIRLKSEGYANKVLAATKPVGYTKLVVK